MPMKEETKKADNINLDKYYYDSKFPVRILMCYILILILIQFVKMSRKFNCNVLKSIPINGFWRF